MIDDAAHEGYKVETVVNRSKIVPEAEPSDLQDKVPEEKRAGDSVNGLQDITLGSRNLLSLQSDTCEIHHEQDDFKSLIRSRQ